MGGVIEDESIVQKCMPLHIWSAKLGTLRSNSPADLPAFVFMRVQISEAVDDKMLAFEAIHTMAHQCICLSYVRSTSASGMKLLDCIRNASIELKINPTFPTTFIWTTSPTLLCTDE